MRYDDDAVVMWLRAKSLQRPCDLIQLFAAEQTDAFNIGKQPPLKPAGRGLVHADMKKDLSHSTRECEIHKMK
jgi:hypothetical protein